MILTLVVLAVSSALDLVTPQEPGTPLHVVGVVVDQSGRPVSGATLHVYQTDTSGRYTPDRPMAESNARLSGRMTTDEKGRFDITLAGQPERRVQVVFADDPLLSDPYWQDWVAKLKQPVATVAAEGRGQVTHIKLTIDRRVTSPWSSKDPARRPWDRR